MKKLVAFVCVLEMAMTTVAQAETWVIDTTSQPSLSQDAEFIEKYRQNTNQEIALSAFEGLMQWQPPDREIERISDGLEKAESAFFANAFALAEKDYLQVQKSILSFPLRGHMSEIVLKTMIRIAQIAKHLKKSNADQKWEEAYAFHPMRSLNSKDYSPEVRKNWLQARERIGKRRFPITVELPNTGLVFLDGKKISENARQVTASALPGHHQLSVLKPGSSWWIKMIQIDGPDKEEVSPLPLITGGCEGPQYTGPELPASITLKALFPENCTRIYKSGKWVERKIPLANLAPNYRESLATDMERPSQSGLTKTLRSPWFWAAVGVVAGGIYYIVQENQKPVETVPVHTGN